MKFGAWVRLERHKRKISIGQMAEFSALGKATLSLVETGLADPKLSTVESIARVFNMTAGEALLTAERIQDPIERLSPAETGLGWGRPGKGAE